MLGGHSISNVRERSPGPRRGVLADRLQGCRLVDTMRRVLAKSFLRFVEPSYLEHAGSDIFASSAIEGGSRSKGLHVRNKGLHVGIVSDFRSRA